MVWRKVDFRNFKGVTIWSEDDVLNGEGDSNWIALSYFQNIPEAYSFWEKLASGLNIVIYFENRSNMITIGLRYKMELYVGK